VSGRSRACGAGAGALGALAVALACAVTEPGTGAPVAAEHVESSVSLRARMRALEYLSQSRLPKELDVEAERERRREGLVRAAEELAGAARALTEGAPPDALSDAQAARFDALARALRERALALAEQAPTADPPTLALSLESIEETCGECHRELGVSPEWVTP
jgi:hypothetical protein